MICSQCKNENAIRIQVRYTKHGRVETCEKCGNLSLEGLPDVSDVHEPYFDEHLADAKHPDGRWIHSRRQKAEVLKEMGLREKRESAIPYIKDEGARRRYFRNHF